MPDDDDRGAPVRDRGLDVVRGRTRPEAFVDLGFDPGGAGDLVGSLTRAEQRAAEHGFRLADGQTLAESARRRAAGVGQRAELVGFAGCGLGVADDDQAHGA
jgi:hypothetical protein